MTRKINLTQKSMGNKGMLRAGEMFFPGERGHQSVSQYQMVIPGRTHMK